MNSGSFFNMVAITTVIAIIIAKIDAIKIIDGYSEVIGVKVTF
jgi:hypothetical protein